MPAKNLHRNFNLFILLPVVLILIYLYFSKDLSLLLMFSILFAYATCFANPDADLANQNKVFTFNGLMSLPFKLFYAPFAKHRSRISHSLLWGTPSRLLAVSIFFSCCLLIYFAAEEVITNGLVLSDFQMFAAKFGVIIHKSYELILSQCINHPKAVILAVIAFFTADFGHLLLDRLGR